MKMKVAVLKDKYDIQIEEWDVPELKEDEVLVKVAVSGICGSDLHAYTHLNFPPGTVMGHEFSGVIEKVNPGEEEWKVGQKVVVRPCGICGECYWCKTGQISICPTHMHTTLGLEPQGAFANYVAVPKYMLYDLPEEISFTQAAQLEPVTVCVHGANLSRASEGDNVLIFGGGPIGLTLYQVIKHRGVNRLILVEPSKRRREIAKKVGVEELYTPEEFAQFDYTNEFERFGFDVVFDCAGAKATLKQSLDVVRKGGQIVMLGIQPEPVEFNQFLWIVKGVDIVASMGYFLGEFEQALQLMKEKAINVDDLVSDIIDLEDLQEKGFEKLLSPEESMKILVRPNGDFYEQLA